MDGMHVSPHTGNQSSPATTCITSDNTRTRADSPDANRHASQHASHHLNDRKPDGMPPMRHVREIRQEGTDGVHTGSVSTGVELPIYTISYCKLQVQEVKYHYRYSSYVIF